MTESVSSDRIADQTGAQLARAGRSWAWPMIFGVLSVLAGILVLGWPGKTILAIAVLLGLWLLVDGVYRLVAAVALDEAQGGSRMLIALLGVLAILAGILCLARPFQTVTALALLLGVFWIVGGVIEIFHGIVGDTPSGRGWALAGGLISVIAGIVVLAYPGTSLAVLALLFGIWLIVLGAVAIAAGFALQRHGTTTVHRGVHTRTAGPVTP